MSHWKDELERKKFIEENPDTMEIFGKTLDSIFGKNDDNNNNNEQIEITEKITSNSKLTIDDVEEISNEITKKSWQKHKEYLEKIEK